MSSIYDWSLFAASNANADDIINWSEGQPPSSVNNSARSMMQRMREFISDLGGVVTATGSANGIALTTTSPVATYANGIVLRFRAIATNTDKTTLNVNNLGAKPIMRPNFSGITPLSGGEIQAGGIYEVIYHQTLNAGSGGWFMPSPTPEQVIPSGMIAPFAMLKAPVGWLECNGLAVSRMTYQSLFNAIGISWGRGDGITTFNLPDYRGVFLRGWDNGRGLDSGRVFASLQESQNRAHNHGGATSTAGNHTHEFVDSSFDGIVTATYGNTGYTALKKDQTRTTAPSGAHSHTIANDGGPEARPVNLTALYAIKV